MADNPRKTGVYDAGATAAKRGVPWWAWVLAALVALGLLWWLLSSPGEDAAPAAPPPAATTAPGTTAPPAAAR